MNWLQKVVNTIRLDQNEQNGAKDTNIPDGLWIKCSSCSEMLYRADLEKNLFVCPKCGKHLSISARDRLNNFFDEGSFSELYTDLSSHDVLSFTDSKPYSSRLSDAKESSNENEAFITASGSLMGRKVISGAFEFSFMGGSMGSVVGEKFMMAAEKSCESNQPLICFCASGGARMQESLFSLMQMARTSASIGKMREKKIPFISVLTNPTFGGVTASLAMLGDINIAEPDALIGFAGPRVIEQTVRQTLPKGFQKSEFLQDHGTIDLIVSRLEMRETISSILAMLVD